MSHTERSSLARLILFMVCLALAGSIVAGAHYFITDMPMQNAVQPPVNGDTCTITPGKFCVIMLNTVCRAPGVIDLEKEHDCLRDFGCCE